MALLVDRHGQRQQTRLRDFGIRFRREFSFPPAASSLLHCNDVDRAIATSTQAPTFDALGLKEDLLRGIYAYGWFISALLPCPRKALRQCARTGFEKPSAIQQRAILPVTKGRDVIAQAQSGTGKTATFSISMLQSIDTSVRETQALVLSPTRELATQIQSVVLALGGTSSQSPRDKRSH